jgi:hypothetical protein
LLNGNGLAFVDKEKMPEDGPEEHVPYRENPAVPSFKAGNPAVREHMQMSQPT